MPQSKSRGQEQSHVSPRASRQRLHHCHRTPTISFVHDLPFRNVSESTQTRHQGWTLLVGAWVSDFKDRSAIFTLIFEQEPGHADLCVALACPVFVNGSDKGVFFSSRPAGALFAFPKTPGNYVYIISLASLIAFFSRNCQRSSLSHAHITFIGRITHDLVSYRSDKVVPSHWLRCISLLRLSLFFLYSLRSFLFSRVCTCIINHTFTRQTTSRKRFP